MSFAKKLKGLMADANLTQAQLSTLTGIGKPSISQYLTQVLRRHLLIQRVAH